jgi:hypothetical protein
MERGGWCWWEGARRLYRLAGEGGGGRSKDPWFNGDSGG